MKRLQDSHKPPRHFYLLNLNLSVLLVAISGFGVGVCLINLLRQLWRGQEFDPLMVVSFSVGIAAPLLTISICIFSINRIVRRLAVREVTDAH